LAGTTQLILQTSASWPYTINPASIAFASFTSSLPAAKAPTGITAIIVQDNTVSLACSSKANSLCLQQWLVTISIGAVANCDIEGLYTYNSTLLCRDGAPCGGAPSGAFAFSLMPTDFCAVGSVDATANSVYLLNAFQDAAHLLPAVSFTVGEYVYFDLTVVDPTSTLKGITFSSIALISSSSQKDTLYTTVVGTTAVSGVNLKIREVNSLVSPGSPADLSFSFQLLRPLLPNTLSPLGVGGSSTMISVEATINLVYYGDKKRDVKIAMELSQGSAATEILVVAQDVEMANNSPVYTIPFLSILALLSFVLLY